MHRQQPVHWKLPGQFHVKPEIEMYDSYSQDFEPTVAGATWQYRWLVLFLALGFAGLGWLLASSREAFTATAAISVEDPRSSNLFGGTGADSPERYVRSQAEIMRSRSVAARAAEIAEEAEQSVIIDTEAIVDAGLTVVAEEDSGLVKLSYTAETSNESVVVVNAIAVAYQEIGREVAIAEYEAALLELDSRIIELTQEGETLQEELRRLRASDAERLALEAQLEEAIARLLLVEPTPPGGTPEAFDQTAARLTEVGLEIATLRAALANDVEDPDINAIDEQYADLQDRLINLQTVRDQRAVDAQLVSSGVAFYDPAVEAQASSARTLVVFGLLLGAVVGSSLALPLARRRRRFASRIEPEAALGAPLLADVPSFFEERLNTNLPTVESPDSAAAESFRFVAAAIALQRDRTMVETGVRSFTSVVVTSTSVAEGKTTVTANTAFAAALEGSRVLVIDADFVDQELTRMLVGSETPEVGLSDVVLGSLDLDAATVSVSMEDAGSVDLLSRGSRDVAAFDLLSSAKARDFFHDLGNHYNLVLIDGPPLPRVAYSTTLVRLADRALVVVAHGEDTRAAEELRRQMDIIETPLLGYVYNLAPLRPEMTLAIGSMGSSRAKSKASDEANAEQVPS